MAMVRSDTTADKSQGRGCAAPEALWFVGRDVDLTERALNADRVAERNQPPPF